MLTYEDMVSNPTPTEAWRQFLVQILGFRAEFVYSTRNTEYVTETIHWLTLALSCSDFEKPLEVLRSNLALFEEKN